VVAGVARSVARRCGKPGSAPAPRPIMHHRSMTHGAVKRSLRSGTAVLGIAGRVSELVFDRVMVRASEDVDAIFVTLSVWRLKPEKGEQNACAVCRPQTLSRV
jgi:hypothetical protein